MNVYRTVRSFESAGVSGVHVEDQTFPKRCGVLAGKKVIAAEDFARRVRAAVDARESKDFVIIARTDAKASLGMEEVIRRLNMYVDNGADMAMLGGFYSLDEYKRIVTEVKAPIVACASCHAHRNIEFRLKQEWVGTDSKHEIRIYSDVYSQLLDAEKLDKWWEDHRPVIVQTAACGLEGRMDRDPPYFRKATLDAKRLITYFRAMNSGEV